MARPKIPPSQPATPTRADQIRHAEELIRLWAWSDVGEAELRAWLRLAADAREDCRAWRKTLPHAFREIARAYRFACAYEHHLSENAVDEALGLESLDAIRDFTLRTVATALAYDAKALRQRPATKTGSTTKPDQHGYRQLWPHVAELAHHLEADHPRGAGYEATKRAAAIVMSVRAPRASQDAVEEYRVRLYADWRKLGGRPRSRT